MNELKPIHIILWVSVMCIIAYATAPDLPEFKNTNTNTSNRFGRKYGTNAEPVEKFELKPKSNWIQTGESSTTGIWIDTGFFVTNNSFLFTNAIQWTVSANTPEINLRVSTNLTVEWVTVETIRDNRNNDPRYQLAIPIYDTLKQIGTVVTNRVLTIEHDGATNAVILKVLGREEWPSQRRTIQVRKQ